VLQVQFHLLKDFHEKYNTEVRRRIGSIKPLQQNRDGAGIRHATHLLSQEDEKVKLLFYLMDGLPHDFGYEGKHAIEDTRRAIIESKGRGCTPVVLSFGNEQDTGIRSLANHCHYVEVSNPRNLPLVLPKVYAKMAV